jgi:hypothetical protein
MPKALPADLARRLDSITLSFAMERSLTTDLPAIQNWHVTATAHDWDDRDDEGDPRPEIVADINIVKGSLEDGSLWLQLDAMAADLEAVATSVMVPDTGDLRPEVEDLVHAAVGSQLLILNSVTVHEPWRGYGVGALLAGEAILALDGDAQCVATYPAPLDSSEGSDRTRAVAKLQRTWAQIGFKPPDECVWILDPGMEDLGDAVARLGSNFGLPAG